MTRRGFLASATAPAVLGQRRRRNIVYILSDDHRDGFYGAAGHPWLKGQTPNLDAMAQRGARFANSFVTTSLCSPSRSTILTGQMLFRHGVVNNTTDLPPGMTTFPQLLQRAGYRTGYLGKWHMGDQNSAPRPGFDHWVSFRGQGEYQNPAFNVNGREERRSGYNADLLNEEALRFLQQSKDRPFCLMLAHKNVHHPFDPAPRHRGKFRDAAIPYPETYPNTEENREGKPAWVLAQRNSWHGADNAMNEPGGFERLYRGYCEGLLAIDESIGLVQAELRRLGLEEETLLVYHSDNGFLHGEHGLIDKRVMYEPSIRVPLLMECPAVIRAPRVIDTLATTLDVAPTLLEFAGVAAPPELPGQSLIPWMEGREAKGREHFVYSYYWEREAPQTPTIFGLRTKQHSFITTQGVWDRHELYDLAADPLQKRNLLGRYRNGMGYGRMERAIADAEMRRWYVELEATMDSEITRLGGTRLASYSVK